jgi:hypothetical protein
MDKDLPDAYAKLLARCDDPERRTELERSIAYAQATLPRFLKDLERAKAALPVMEVGTLAGPLKQPRRK